MQRSGRILSREDEDVSTACTEILESEGVTILTGKTTTALVADDDGVTVEFDDGSSVRGSHVLVAIGRVPNTHDLNLEAAGVEANNRGFIAVDDHCKTSADNIWALGDCNGLGAFTHTSYNESQVVADNVLGKDEERSVKDRFTIYNMYIDPPLARVGLNKQQAIAEHGAANVLRAHRPMARVGRAKERGETAGFMEVLVHAETDQILGSTIVGVGGDEVIACVATAMYAGATATQLGNATIAHPTVAELLTYICGYLSPLEEPSS